jgi:RNA polymerase sigma factor (sigma-70 family)
LDNVVSLPVKGVESDKNAVLLDSLDDDALAAMAQAGVDRALELLVRRHQRMVLGTAVKYLGDTISAEDIAQNSFMDLFRNIDRYRPEGKFRAFLAKIVINNCRMANRRTRSETSKQQRFQSLQEAKPLDEDTFIEREHQRLIDKALRSLGTKLREVMILRYAADLSYKEIGETLGIRVGTVKSRLFAGVEKLSQALEAVDK